MPRGTCTGRTVHVLMSSALLMAVVHKAEAARTNMLATMADEVDIKNVQVCLITPLKGTKKSKPRQKICWQDGTNVASDMVARMEPSNRR